MCIHRMPPRAKQGRRGRRGRTSSYVQSRPRRRTKDDTTLDNEDATSNNEDVTSDNEAMTSNNEAATSEDDGWSSGESEPKYDSSDQELDVDEEYDSGDDGKDAIGGQWYYNTDFTPSIPPFESETGLCDVPLAGNNISGYFLLFFDEGLMQIIVDEINRYHKQKKISAAMKEKE